MSLEGKHDNDGIDEAQQCHRAKVGHESLLKAFLANCG